MARKNKNVPATRGTTAPVNMANQMALDAQEGSGFENMNADDLAIPFLVILQSGSPQVKRGQGHLEGAEEGDFFNTVTNEIMKGEISLICCAYEKAWIEWILRENGGGFVLKHGDDSILKLTKRDDRNRNILENGHQIVDTAYHYCLLVREDGIAEPVVLGLISTQLKKSRRWNSTMQGLKVKIGKEPAFTPPMYSHMYKAETVEEDNDQGQWMGWLIHAPEMIKDFELYAMAKKFHDDVTTGQIRTAPPPQGDNSTDTKPVEGDDEHF
ncbi:hypothetical protein KAR91_48985 [Candidatus Pacearchaeota archaeon]|nr:hypothetical protein [Candidatus Pacearchaeota archaeon]